MPITKLASKETNYDLLFQDYKLFYGYDSEFSCGETEIYVPSFDKRNIIDPHFAFNRQRASLSVERPGQGRYRQEKIRGRELLKSRVLVH